MTCNGKTAVSKSDHEPRTLKLDDWPQTDRVAWETACRPGHRLKRGGSASHLAPVSREAFASRYGLYLGFLKRSGRLDRHAAAAALVTPPNVEDYITELGSRVGSVTAYISIHMLRRAAELLAPDMNFSWLAEIEKDLALVMEPRSKFDRLILTERLVGAGLSLIAEAKEFARTDLARARGIRNGLMIALLADRPIRLKNFSALEIGATLRRIGERWWITLPRGSTKSRRPDERPVAIWLNAYIDLYLNDSRPFLLGQTPDTNALWLSSTTGRPMTSRKVGSLISQITLETLEVAISPHLFRTSAATVAAVDSRNLPHLASALLGHIDPRVTEEHYNRASSIDAARIYAEIIQQHYSGVAKDS
jgi:integrase